MNELSSRIEAWLDTERIAAPPDLDAVLRSGRRVRRARAIAWSAVGLVTAVAVVATVLVAVRPGSARSIVVPARRPRTQVRYPDGRVVSWPAPANGLPWLAEGPALAVQDDPAQARLQQELLHATPGGEISGPVLLTYRVGTHGRIGEYTAEVSAPAPSVGVSVLMTRGGVPAGNTTESYDPCGVWPGRPNLGEVGRRFFFGSTGPHRCEVRPDARTGWVVHTDLLMERVDHPARWLRSFTVRPDGTAVSAGVIGSTADLGEFGTPSRWQGVLDKLVTSLPYPADE